MVHSTPLQDSQIRHHASSLGQIVIKAFAFQELTQRIARKNLTIESGSGAIRVSKNPDKQK
jgi:hypothetical protein